MRVTEAAQRVQRAPIPRRTRSGPTGQVLAQALVGKATGAVACTRSADAGERGPAAVTALGAGLRPTGATCRWSPRTGRPGRVGARPPHRLAVRALAGGAAPTERGLARVH